MNYHPDVLAAHAEFGGDLQSMQALYDRPDHIARIAALEAKLAERVVELREVRKVISDTHKRGVKHENCDNSHCPICEGGLFVCADCGAAEIETEQRVCSGPAREATPPAPKVKTAKPTYCQYPKCHCAIKCDEILTAAQEAGKP